MSKRIKILFTISNFNTAGSGKVVYDLVNGLDKTVFDIEIACSSNDGAFFKTIEELGIPIHIFNTKTPYKPYYNILKRINKISKFYRKHNYDIVHSWQWSSDWTEAMAARVVGVKWIYTKKAMGFSNKHWKIKSYLANYIITINDEMRTYFPNKKAQALIPLGIDTEYYNSNSIDNNRNYNDGVYKIITVANLVPVKGIEVLIEAVYKLKDKSIELTILGNYSNNYGQEMVALSEKLGMQNQINFLGKKRDVRPYIANSDLYVIPTLNKGRKEGMPMALVEAMSMAIPVLGSDITGVNFVLKEFKHLLFSAGDATALVQKIKYLQLMDKQASLELKNSLRKYCEENFAMDAFIQRHEALYKNIVNGEF